MQITCKAGFNPQWTLTDDKIIIGSKEIELSSIKRINMNMEPTILTGGCIQLVLANDKIVTLAYTFSQKMQGKEALEYIKSYIGLKKDIRKKCNVCGHIFCYTAEDIERNAKLERSAAGSSFAGVFNAFDGNYAASSTNAQSANDQLARVVDYNKCPKCGSRNLVDATEEDVERSKAPQGTVVQQISAADELRKFKELLDMGIITQEEFDAKKKQLLGL